MADGADRPKLGGSRGNAGKGRRRGSKNKTTALIKEAIVLAAQAVGSDGKGKNGLVGYCEDLARNEKKAFAALMGRAMPVQVEGGGENGAIVAEIVIRGISAANR